MLSPEDQYERVRSRWVREDDLINHRLTWLLVSQSLLFAAYGALLNIAAGSPCQDKIDWLALWLPLVGIVTSLLILLSIGAAFAEMVRLRKEDVRVAPNLWITFAGLVAPLVLPVVFAAAWAFV